MFNMIKNAKNLIKKGRETGDLELVTMGMQLLNDYNPEIDGLSKYEKIEPTNENSAVIITTEHIYKCTNCGYYFPIDRNNRKQCPQCNKKTLIVQEKREQKEIPVKITHRATAKDFGKQIRNPTSNKKLRYNDQGQIEGTYTRSEQIEGVTNVWSDDKIEGFDEENERLKKITKVSPRTRKPTKLVKVTCENCKNLYEVHPIHAGARGRYLCDKCIARRSKT